MNSYAIPFLPERASSVAGEVDAVYFFMIANVLFFGLIVVVLLAVCAIKYRRRDPLEIPRPIAGAMSLEMMWTVIPFIIAMGMFVWGAKLYLDLYHMPKDTMDMYVVGKQWMWKIQHPTGQREINELHVPRGRKIKLVMTTEDVIHAFFIPDFRVKADVIPGRYTTIWFDATKTGKYHLFCSEYCGTNHSFMGGWVYVMEPDEYERWLSGNAGNVSPAEAGHQLLSTLGCASCHGSEGQGGRCPTFKNLYGSQVQLTNGSSVTANDDYIRESILSPSAKIVAGYTNIMPTFQGQVSEEQLLQIIAYIKTLAPTQSSGTTSTLPASNSNNAKPGATPVSAGTPSATAGQSNNANSSNTNANGNANSGNANNSTPRAPQQQRRQ